MRGRPRYRSVVAVVIMALVATSCSGDGGDEPGGGRQATGPPIPVGLINMEGAPVGSFPELREGAAAAARYVNEELGGVDGRPLALENCATDGTPESSQRCALKVLEKKPVAVIGGVDLGAAASLPVIESGAVPYLASSPTLGEELTSPSSFAFTGGTAADLLAQAEYALGTLKAEKVSVLHVDLPGLLSTVVRAANVVLRRRGATDVKLVAEKADAADYSSALVAATRDRPDALFVVFPPQSCARIMQARRALNVTVRTFYPGACADQAVVDAAGGGADQAYFGSGYLPLVSDDADVAVYRQHGEEERQSALAQAGFSAVMNLHRLMREAGGGAATAATLRSELESARDHPSFMAHPFTCDRKQVPLLVSVCNPWVRILQFRDGRFHDVVRDWVSGADLVKLFG